jgi:glycosyltransferase involved in cell wall biosynthesis
MRILIVHTYYQAPGGEDLVFHQEKKLLSQQHTVTEYIAHNQKGLLGAIQTFLSPWNYKASQGFEKVIRQFRPDVIHIHNLHYALGPWLLRTAKKCGVPVVLTLHNYRYLCPSATLFADGQIFTQSLYQSFPWTAVTKAVHSQSVIKTFWLALTHYLHRQWGTFRQVDRFIALTTFARELFIQSPLHLLPSQVVVKPNFVFPSPQEEVPRSEHFLFVGRLSEEKGIRVLLEAFRHSPYKLRIAGQGPLLEEVKRVCATTSNIEYLGVLDRSTTLKEMAECSALVFPSIWFEGMPMTILEALSVGTISIASRLGAMQSMITPGENGWLFDAGKAASLENALQKWQQLEVVEQSRMRRQARETYLSLYTPESNYQQLIEIYQSVLPKQSLNY